MPPPGNPNAAPAAYHRLLSAVPSHVIDSWDWRQRCHWQPAHWKRHMPRGMTFIKALEQRLKLMDTVPALSHPYFDLGAARLPREVVYTTKQAAISSAVLKDCGTVDARLFCLNQAFFKTVGFPTNAERDLDVLSPLLKKWERQTRHRTGFIIPFQQKEAFCFNHQGLSMTCIKVPSWFGPYEVHYGLHMETPPIATYRGSALMADEQSPEWQTFLTEWGAMLAYELMYQARQGRLHFITTQNRGLIRDVGFSVIMFGRDDLAAKLETLIDEIDVIKWSEVSPENRALPDHACDTHVSITGNWVAFDASEWESQMEDDMYILPDEWGPKAFDHPRGSLTGLIDRRAEEQRTTRPVRSGAEEEVPPKWRLLELDAPAGKVVQKAPEVQEEAPFKLPNEKAQRRLARTLDQLMIKAGVRPLITDYGYPEGLPLDAAVDIIRLHLGTCVNRAGPSGPGANAPIAGPSGSPSVKIEGNPSRRNLTIREEMDREEERELQAKDEATVAKEEPQPSTAAIAPRAYLKPSAGKSSSPGAGSHKLVGAALNRRLDVEVINLLSDDEGAVMTDVES